ncbi:hypothetical protein [Pedobacter sp.]|jgi:hypothetical protein|uniref:hypothetical protein n=1 Tax=Pedobacter sp. TaxID=1411316 RepID=UPI002C4B139C|nr:hypothetical protein [Pedobacter sp.]HWW37906.1 hypothetical protein [Pedobacter sp.]
MTYQEAIEDYDSKSTEDRNILLFALYGRAMYRAQVLEQQAVNMLAIYKLFKSPPNTQEEYQEIWNRYDFSRSTLGIKAEEIKTSYSLSEQDSLEFKKVITLRNNLTHTYFRFNDNLFFSDAGKKQMIKDFIHFLDQSKAMDNKLMAYMEKYNKKAGITEERIQELLAGVKEEWSNKQIDHNYDSTIKNNQ